MSTNIRDHGEIYREELEHEYVRVVLSDVVARSAMHCARQYKCDDVTQMKAMIVGLSNANRELMMRLEK